MGNLARVEGRARETMGFGSGGDGSVDHSVRHQIISRVYARDHYSELSVSWQVLLNLGLMLALKCSSVVNLDNPA